MASTAQDLVAAHVQRLRESSLDADDSILALVLEDLHRPELRALTLLVEGPLVEAYDAMLESGAKLMLELMNHGIDLASIITETAFPDSTTRWYLRDVQQLCSGQIRNAVTLRTMLDERSRRISESKAS